jgi:hypothetical protein
MNPIEELKTQLAKYPAIKYKSDSTSITVPPQNPNSFEVRFAYGENDCLVFYEGWHEHFTASEEAMKCFLFGLSPNCRLRVLRRGVYDYQWTLQILENGNWIAYDTTRLLFFPFWRRRKVIILQNNYINNPHSLRSAAESGRSSAQEMKGKT